MLSNLGETLHRQYRRTGSIDDLDRAITTMEQAVSSSSEGDPLLAVRLSNLGIMLTGRFERTGSLHSLDRAVRMMEQATVSLPDGDPVLALILLNFASTLHRRFEQTGSMDDLDRVITAIERAVLSTPENHPRRAELLRNLGAALHERFKRMGSMNDLDRVITTLELAVSYVANYDLDRGTMLSTLGSALQRRFERTGSMDDLDRAVTMKDQAVTSTPEDHPGYFGGLNNLGWALENRFEKTGSMADLDWAIRVKEKAIATTPNDYPGRAKLLTNLGNLLESRFDRTGSMADLDRAIREKEKVIAITSNDYPDRAKLLTNLGCLLQGRFDRTESMDDINHVIKIMDQAVVSSRDDHRYRAARLSDFATALQYRFERTGSIDDLDRAIGAREQAVASTPDDDPYRAARLSDLEYTVQTRTMWRDRKIVDDKKDDTERWMNDSAPFHVSKQPLLTCTRLRGLLRPFKNRKETSTLQGPSDVPTTEGLLAVPPSTESKLRSKNRKAKGATLSNSDVTTARGRSFPTGIRESNSSTGGRVTVVTQHKPTESRAAHGTTDPESCAGIHSDRNEDFVSFSSLVERSITSWNSFHYIGENRSNDIRRCGEILRSIISLEDLLRRGTFWFFQTKESFVKQTVFMKWNPARLDVYILFPRFVPFVKSRHCLFVSHYWRTCDDPDPDGEDMAALRDTLESGPWSYIWIDWTCLPQSPRTLAQRIYFKEILPSIPSLLRVCGFVCRSPGFQARAWIFFEVVGHMLFRDDSISNDNIEYFLSHMKEMVEDGVKSVLTKHDYKCTNGEDLEFLIPWIELFVILFKLVRHGSTRRRIIDNLEHEHVGTLVVTDDSGDILIDKNKGIVSHRMGTFEFPPVFIRKRHSLTQLQYFSVSPCVGNQKTHVILRGEGDFELCGNELVDGQPLPCLHYYAG